MKKLWNKEASIEFSQIEWLTIKVPFIFYWLRKILGILFTYKSTIVPHGIFSLGGISETTLAWLNPVLIILTVLLVAAYLVDFKMVLTTLLLFVVSVFTFSLEESNGVLNRSSLLSFLFFAQAIAYLIPLFNPFFTPKNNRILFSIQAIAATYTLSALSKLKVTGISWIFSGKYMTLQILKSYQYKYVTNGNWEVIERGNEMALFIQNHPKLVMVLLTIALILELFALLCLRNKYSIIIYGALLTIMHFSMAVVMDINLSSISAPMFIFMINPLYALWVVYSSYIKQKKQLI
jgi:hypothetical protein